MKKIIFAALAVVAIAVAAPVFASKPLSLPENAKADLPEQAGIYDVAGHPNLKLRVFVHNEKPDAKPGKPIPTLNEVCGLSDPNSSSLVPEAGWTLPSSWTYRLNTESVPSTVGKDKLATIAQNAFSTWLTGDASRVAIVKGDDTLVNKAQYDGQNVITWGRTSASALAVSYIWFDTITQKAVEIDTIMNQRYTWAWSDSSKWPSGDTCAYDKAYDAQNILTHELGHTFGLDDVYDGNFVDNTMYGYGSTRETKKDTLTNGDISGVNAIY